MGGTPAAAALSVRLWVRAPTCSSCGGRESGSAAAATAEDDRRSLAGRSFPNGTKFCCGWCAASVGRPADEQATAMRSPAGSERA